MAELASPPAPLQHHNVGPLLRAAQQRAAHCGDSVPGLYCMMARNVQRRLSAWQRVYTAMRAIAAEEKKAGPEGATAAALVVGGHPLLWRASSALRSARLLPYVCLGRPLERMLRLGWASVVGACIAVAAIWLTSCAIHSAGMTGALNWVHGDAVAGGLAPLQTALVVFRSHDAVSLAALLGKTQATYGSCAAPVNGGDEGVTLACGSTLPWSPRQLAKLTAAPDAHLRLRTFSHSWGEHLEAMLSGWREGWAALHHRPLGAPELARLPQALREAMPPLPSALQLHVVAALLAAAAVLWHAARATLDFVLLEHAGLAVDLAHEARRAVEGARHAASAVAVLDKRIGAMAAARFDSDGGGGGDGGGSSVPRPLRTHGARAAAAAKLRRRRSAMELRKKEAARMARWGALHDALLKRDATALRAHLEVASAKVQTVRAEITAQYDTKALKDTPQEVVAAERRLRRLLGLLRQERAMQRRVRETLLGAALLLLLSLPLLSLGAAARALCAEAGALYARHHLLLQQWGEYAAFAFYGYEMQRGELPQPRFSCPLSFGLSDALAFPADVASGGDATSMRLPAWLVLSGAGLCTMVHGSSCAWRYLRSSRHAEQERAAQARQRQVESDELSERAFMQGLQVSLSYCCGDGSFVFCTLFEVEDMRKLTTNRTVCLCLLRAARQTTPDFPFLHSIPAHEHRIINKLVVNAISDRFSEGHLAHAALSEAGDGASTRLTGGTYWFGLACERGGTFTRKVRVMVVSEALLRCVADMAPPRMSRPDHATRWATIQAMARIAAEEWDNPDEARGEAGPVLSKVEIYVPLALVPWPESPHLASFSSPLMSPLRTRSPGVVAASGELGRAVAGATEPLESLLASPVSPVPQRSQTAAEEAQEALQQAMEAAALYGHREEAGGSAGRGGLRGTIGSGERSGGGAQHASPAAAPQPRMLWPADASPGAAIAAIAAAAAAEGRVAAAAASAFAEAGATAARTPPVPPTRRRLELRRARTAQAAPPRAVTPAETADVQATAAATAVTVERPPSTSVVVKRAVF